MLLDNNNSILRCKYTPFNIYNVLNSTKNTLFLKKTLYLH